MSTKLVMRKMKLRYFSSLTSKQKDDANKKVCELLSKKYPDKYINPTLWGILFDVSFTEIMNTKEAADQLCKGKCILYNGLWLPIKLKNM